MKKEEVNKPTEDRNIFFSLGEPLRRMLQRLIIDNHSDNFTVMERIAIATMVAVRCDYQYYANLFGTLFNEYRDKSMIEKDISYATLIHAANDYELLPLKRFQLYALLPLVFDIIENNIIDIHLAEAEAKYSNREIEDVVGIISLVQFLCSYRSNLLRNEEDLEIEDSIVTYTKYFQKAVEIMKRGFLNP